MSSQRKVNQLTCLNFTEMLFTTSQNEDRGPDFEDREPYNRTDQGADKSNSPFL